MVASVRSDGNTSLFSKSGRRGQAVDVRQLRGVKPTLDEQDAD